MPESPSISPSPSSSPYPGYEDYSSGNYASLPADNSNLEYEFSGSDYLRVDTDDETYVSQSAEDEFAIFLFKDFVGDYTSVTPTWNGKTDLAPLDVPVYLQIYNHNTSSWDTLDIDNATAASTDFTLSATVSDLTNYKDDNLMTSCRVYQGYHYDLYVDGSLASDEVGSYSVENRNGTGSETAYKTIQNAINSISSGQSKTIGVREGTYYPATFISFLNKSGQDADNPITMRAYKTTTASTAETVVIDGTSTAISTINGLVSINNSSYITLIDMTVQNYASYGIRAKFDCDYCEYDSLEVANSTKHGMYIDRSDYAHVHHCVVHDNADNGIYMSGSSYCLIELNELYGNNDGIQSVGLWVDPDFYLAKYNIIRNNLSYNNNKTAEDSDGISVSTGSRYCQAVNNICFGNTDDGVDFSTGSTADIYPVVEGYGAGHNIFGICVGNISFNHRGNEGAGDGNGIKIATNWSYGHLVAYNISFGNISSGIIDSKKDGYPRNYIYNNTTYDNDYYGIYLDTHSTDPNERVLMYNNIAYSNGVVDVKYALGGPSVYDADNNFYGDGSFYTGEDENSLSGDPKFTNATAVIDTNFTGTEYTIEQKLAYIRNQVEAKLGLASDSTAINSGQVIAGFHNASAGLPNTYGNIWYGAAPDMGGKEHYE